MISCILLTAGESKRFGSPKALAPIGDHNAIGHIQQTLIASLIKEIIVVTGAHKELIKPHVFNHKKVSVVYNKSYKLGQTSSFQTGINATDITSKGYMLFPVDCPFISVYTINTLITSFSKNNPDILIPTYQNHRGHPPIFNQRIKNNILNLPTDKGINTLFEKFPPQTITMDDPGIIKTFNTPEELNKIIK